MQSLIFMIFNDKDDNPSTEKLIEFYELYKLVPKLNDAHDIKLFYTLCYFYENYDLDKLKLAGLRIMKKNNLV